MEPGEIYSLATVEREGILDRARAAGDLAREVSRRRVRVSLV